MAIRDLGYRPYDGERHEASRNTLVLLRHSMKRAWRSWIVKLALLFSWVPMTGFGLVGFLFKMGGRELEPNNLVYMLMQTQWPSSCYSWSMNYMNFLHPMRALFLVCTSLPLVCCAESQLISELGLSQERCAVCPSSIRNRRRPLKYEQSPSQGRPA